MLFSCVKVAARFLRFFDRITILIIYSTFNVENDGKSSIGTRKMFLIHLANSLVQLKRTILRK